MLLWVNGSALDNQSQTGKAGRETESHEMTVMAETEVIIGATETLGEKTMVMVDTQVVVTETEALSDMRTGEEAETGETVIEEIVSKEEADRLGVVVRGTHGMIATDLVHETSVTEMIMVEMGGEHGQVQAEWTTATKRIVKHSSQKIRMLFHQDIVVHHVNYLGLVNPCCPRQQVQLSQARQVSASLIQKVNISLDHVEM